MSCDVFLQMREEEQAVLRQQEVEIMNKLKEAIQSGKKLERTSQPAIVVENKEPPEVIELLRQICWC